MKKINLEKYKFRKFNIGDYIFSKNFHNAHVWRITGFIEDRYEIINVDSFSKRTFSAMREEEYLLVTDKEILKDAIVNILKFEINTNRSDNT